MSSRIKHHCQHGGFEFNWRLWVDGHMLIRAQKEALQCTVTSYAWLILVCCGCCKCCTSLNWGCRCIYSGVGRSAYPVEKQNCIARLLLKANKTELADLSEHKSLLQPSDDCPQQHFFVHCRKSWKLKLLPYNVSASRFLCKHLQHFHCNARAVLFTLEVVPCSTQTHSLFEL